MQNNILNQKKEKGLELAPIINKYLSLWRWFFLGTFISMIIAIMYLRYTTPQYKASATILVKDEKKGGMLSELSAFSELGLGGVKSNIDNEIEILKSRSLIENTVKRLNLNVSLLMIGRINNGEIYKTPPIKVNFYNKTVRFYNSVTSFSFTELDSNTFKIDNTLNKNNVFCYGDLIKTKVGDLIIKKSKGYVLKESEKKLSIFISPINKVVNSFRSRLEVMPLSKTSSIVDVSMVDADFFKAEDFLNNLIQIYNENAIWDKNFISEKTSDFIVNRLNLITQELDGVENDVESFKTANKLTDIDSEAKIYLEGSNQYNNKGIDIDVQLNVVSSMLDFLKKSTNSDLLPTNIINNQENATGLINNYNQLILNRNRILKTATLENPSVIKIDQEISSLKATILNSLRRLQSTLTIQKRDSDNQFGIINAKIGKIPVQEHKFRVIARQQKVKEELYLYLLQKREESAISLSATEANARVIDPAKSLEIPVLPNRKSVYLIALLLGLIIPFSIINLIELLDTKVKTRFDITDKFNIPFLGDVPKALTPNLIIDTASRTSTAEALRIVRTNIDYMLTQVPDDKAKCIFVTSTIPGEGKTFLSVNLAAVFAHSGKKVLLIGMDIRKPKLDEYFGLSDTKGLTDYLSTKNVDITDYIKPIKEFESFEVLLGGVIPPNPTEMLMSKKLDELFAQLKGEYDYIIVDTAPVSLVSDTLIIAKHADTFVYVIRANYLDKNLLSVPDTLHTENKLPNMAFILNDTQISKGYGYGGYGYGGYGYGAYGYGVTVEKKPWYKKIFKK
ncbi:polysaccharide biosynthesis tyrosine autokinase [Flavobacterium sp.]|uniref:GumC family protein n=1 Tax=Flavobacterium sp. TaxID=239 RepID=UPI00286E2ABF|nr:polysaccharide biosynthesis tyrosine autokinase [Flavobacterium sp.]